MPNGSSGSSAFTPGDKAPLWRRKPRRITITVPDITYNQLLESSNRQGRSISNLAAYLLEHSVQDSLDHRRDQLHRDHDNRQAA